MNEEVNKIPVQISTSIEYGQKKKLEFLARTKANGTDTDQAPYLREGLDLVFEKYNVPEEVPAP